jgi:hypothetical protein
MINLRYHVVTITAIFLALALGLTLGSTFLERATVEALNGQLGSLKDDLKASSEKIDDLEAQVADQQQAADEFAEQGVAPLLQGELAEVPVIVVVPQGTDEALVDRSLSTLITSGANVTGTWFATDRLALDDEAEVRDLANVLGIETDLEARLRRTLAQRLSIVLLDRMEPVVAPAGPDTTTSTTPAPTTTDTTGGDVDIDVIEVPDPALMADLVTAGFLEFQPLGDSAGEATLPADSARLLIVADPNADLTPDQFLLPLLDNITLDGPASVVLASGLADGADPATRGEVVDLVRDNARLSDRLSTVDDMEVFEGWAAMVLAIEHVSEGRIAHYGKADSASRLLPATDGPT